VQAGSDAPVVVLDDGLVAVRPSAIVDGPDVGVSLAPLVAAIT